jgi:hypothetical protein
MSISSNSVSYEGYCGLAVESSYGAGEDPSVYLPIRSDGFTSENNPIFDSNIRGRERFEAAAGAFIDEGSIEMVAGPENGLGYLLNAAFGDASVSSSSEGSGSVETHTFDTADDLDSLAVELGLGRVKVGDVQKARAYPAGE